MTVAELITELKKHPQGMKVITPEVDCDSYEVMYIEHIEVFETINNQLYVGGPPIA